MIIGSIVLLLGLIGFSFLGVAWLTDRHGDDAEEKLAAVIPGMIGLAFLAADAGLVAVYAFYRLFFG